MLDCSTQYQQSPHTNIKYVSLVGKYRKALIKHNNALTCHQLANQGVTWSCHRLKVPVTDLLGRGRSNIYNFHKLLG